MAYLPAKGDALMMPSGPVDHLYVILTDAFIGSGYQTHLLANFSSIKASIYYDPACVVSPGEHPFLTLDSYVAYEYARIEMVSDLARRVDSGTYQLHPDSISSRLLDKMRNGVLVSRHISRGCRGYYEKNK